MARFRYLADANFLRESIPSNLAKLRNFRSRKEAAKGAPLTAKNGFR
jgi:hypothetical protein